MNLKKIGKVFTSKFAGTGPSSYKKKNLPDRGLTKVEKHWLRTFLISSAIRRFITLFIRAFLSSVLTQMDPVHVSKFFLKIHIEVIVPSKFRSTEGKEKRSLYSSDVGVFLANFCLQVIFQLRGTVNFQRLSNQTFLLQGSFLQIPQVFHS